MGREKIIQTDRTYVDGKSLPCNCGVKENVELSQDIINNLSAENKRLQSVIKDRDAEVKRLKVVEKTLTGVIRIALNK